jgi:hypothetical protein
VARNEKSGFTVSETRLARTSKKPRHEPEYVLRIFHHFDERTNVREVVFQIETVKIFTHFDYEVLLEDSIKGKTIELRILGIHTPTMLMPSTGPARGRRGYVGLKGTFTVRVIKLNGASTELAVRLSADSIELVEPVPTSFVLAQVDPMEITRS